MKKSFLSKPLETDQENITKDFQVEKVVGVRGDQFTKLEIISGKGRAYLAYIAGNNVVVYDLVAKEQQIIQGTNDADQIVSFAVSQS